MAPIPSIDHPHFGGVIQSFDCIIAPPGAPPQMVAGTYRLGAIIWDTSGIDLTVAPRIATYINPLIDGVIAVIDGPVQIHLERKRRSKYETGRPRVVEVAPYSRSRPYCGAYIVS